MTPGRAPASGAPASRTRSAHRGPVARDTLLLLHSSAQIAPGRQVAGAKRPRVWVSYPPVISPHHTHSPEKGAIATCGRDARRSSASVWRGKCPPSSRHQFVKPPLGRARCGSAPIYRVKAGVLCATLNGLCMHTNISARLVPVGKSHCNWMSGMQCINRWYLTSSA